MKILVDKNKVAIYYKDKAITYKELILDIKKLTKFSNLKEKSNILIFMENRPEYLISFFSIWDSKATAVCIDASSTAEELSYYIDNSDSTKIITSSLHHDKVKEALNILQKNVEIIVVDNIDFASIDMAEIKEEDLYVNAPEKEDVAFILYTSGTTGKPKGVMLTFDNLLANIESLDEHKMFSEEDITIALLPLHHILPLLGTGILPLIYSATIVFLEEISSAALMETMKKYKVSMLIAVPRLWEMIHKKIMDTINSKAITRFIFKLAQKINSLSFSRKIFKKVNEGFGGNVKSFISGGSKLNSQIAADFYTLGLKICEGYGMTETSPIISFTPMDDIIPGCAGRVIKDVEVKIAEDGEILVQGRNVMKGYYKNPEATSQIIKDGWLHTGDLGYLKGKHLYVTGRKKDMIVLSNGKNINPIEIEDQIMSMTNLISEIVVIDFKGALTAVIHPDFVKVKEEKIANVYETLKWNIVDIYNQKVADYKKVLDVKILNEDFPKTKIGKIKRFLIPDLLEGKIEKKVRKEEPDFDEYVKIKKYLVGIKGEEVYQDSHLEIDLKMDSLDMVEFLYFLELNFGIKEEDLISKNPTLIELANYIREHKSSEKIGNLNWNDIVNKNVDVKVPSSSIFSSFIRMLSLIVFKTYIRAKVENKTKLSDKKAIYVGNHQSFLDGFLFNYAISGKILRNSYYMATADHFKSSFRKGIANMSNIVLVDVNKDIAEVIQTMSKILKDGKNVVIFPEGLRTRDGKLNPFRKTFAILAKELNVDVHPFVIKGAYECWPTAQKFPKAAKVELKFLDRIENTASMTYEEIVDRAYEVIKNELEN